jgi:hypothetical protein
MTEQQIDTAIAEACGWTIELSILQSGLEVVRDGKRKPLPDYCNDLNAMHEAEKVLTGLNCHAFCDALLDIVADSPDHLWEVLTASSRQRAEAFLRTLGKWEEAE